ncbi:MAG: hypothetical protein KKF62_10275 [Bacteroidetes bacterium]|nr:hypothetical protein [Bacteroidota bacterium]MBU1115486.1 hypothetical protein [Bacteroidota bacterium]MBU1798163.1 hypothetical protein [Bacteroidota bacterium]
MLAKKKKLSKKEIKEDKLVTSFYEAKSFYGKNQTMLFALVGGIAVIILVVLFYSSKMKENNLLASVEVSRVINTYNAGLYQQAIDGKEGTKEIGLIKIVDEYSGTEQGELARIYLANAYFYTEQYEKALDEYDDYSGSDNLMIASALAGKASCYEVNKDYENAAKYFAKAANVNEYIPANPDYLLNAGVNYIKIKNISEAKVVLNKIKNDYSTSPAARQVDKYLAQVKN